MSFVTSDRRFQVWEYQVSHGQLLIRSPATPATATTAPSTNLDLVFVGVSYMNVPNSFDGLAVEGATPNEHAHVEQLLGETVPREWVRTLHSGGQRFVVVAAGYSLSENDWDVFESPFEFRSRFRGT